MLEILNLKAKLLATARSIQASEPTNAEVAQAARRTTVGLATGMLASEFTSEQL